MMKCLKSYVTTCLCWIIWYRCWARIFWLACRNHVLRKSKFALRISRSNKIVFFRRFARLKKISSIVFDRLLCKLQQSEKRERRMYLSPRDTVATKGYRKFRLEITINVATHLPFLACGLSTRSNMLLSLKYLKSRQSHDIRTTQYSRRFNKAKKELSKKVERESL